MRVNDMTIRRWFPRVGGDRPIEGMVGVDNSLVPPRGRG